jgi:predicted RNase H-related nuclease YkuK (DUF458 family)
MSKTKKGKGKKRERGLDSKQTRVAPAHLSVDPYSVPPFETWTWKQFTGNKNRDIKQFILDHKDCIFFVGTDSQQFTKSKKCVWASTLCAWYYDKEAGTGHGADAIKYTHKTKIIPREAMSARLTVEVQRSIELCAYLEKVLQELTDESMANTMAMIESGEITEDDYYKYAIDYTENIGGVTIDVSKEEINASCKYKDALVGMVVSRGWQAFVKPEAWASSNVADRANKR